MLLDNSQQSKWSIRTPGGREGLIPAVCLLIPPPNHEAIQMADRLRVNFERLIALWRQTNNELKLRMITATINVVKNWDIATVRENTLLLPNIPLK